MTRMLILGDYLQKERSSQSDSLLSDMMPDIAMATSSMAHMSMQDMDRRMPRGMTREAAAAGSLADLELDLGDGAHHSSGTGTLYI